MIMESSLKNIEIDILLGRNVSENVTLTELVQYAVEGKYEAALNTTTAQNILKTNTEEVFQLENILKNNVEIYMSDATEESRLHSELELLTLAVSCLQVFVQNNWMGPVTRTQVTEHLPACFCDDDQYKSLNEVIMSALSVDGEPVYNKCDRAVYLYIARCILLECREHFRKLQTVDWWVLRCLMIQQQLLDDRSPTLRATCLEIIDRVSKLEPLLTDDNNRELIIQFHLEAAYCSIQYFEYKMATDHVTTARKVGGLKVELTGVLGKRTRFQEEAKAQLVLKVTRETTERESQELDNKPVIPKVLPLDDDTVLDVVELEDTEEQFAPDLSPVEQALILGIMEIYRRSRAVEKITEEEVLTYLDCVLSQVRNWCVAVHALMLRSYLQKDSGRRVERSMMQLEETVSQTKREEPPPCQRLYLFYSTKIQPVWMIQKQLAELLLSIGAVGSALDVFEQLQMWEEAISCYKALGKMEKAEAIIREQLAIKETPNLLCFLGDVTREISCYEKAWELSNHKSARAARCIAYQYFGNENYESALEWFKKSLTINNLQIPVWFTCGCCAMTAKNYQYAVTAFKKCVNIDSDNFEAWNNLASSYVQLNEYKKAFLMIKEAVKYRYDNWRVWDNLLVIATDCGEFFEAISAYNRLIDIKDKWIDEKILEVLVRAAVENIPDAKGLPGKRIASALLTLFGRITATVSSNGTVWKLYAKLTDFAVEDSPEKREKVLQYLKKSHRCVIQNDKWVQSIDNSLNVTTRSVELASMYEGCSERSPTSATSIQLLSSAKLMLKGVVSKIRQHHTDPVTGDLADSVKEMCSMLDAKIEHIVGKITELKGS